MALSSLLLLLSLLAHGLSLQCPSSKSSLPLIIGHRGGILGSIPEHTSAAYTLGAENGADYLEPDVVMTKDKVLVVRHDLDLNETTQVAQMPEFASKAASRSFWDPESGNVTVTGYFVDDFTLEELKRIPTKSRNSPLGKGTFDGLYPILTFEEVLSLTISLSYALGREIGIYPEAKRADYFRERGLPLEPKMLDILAKKRFIDELPPTSSGEVHYRGKKRPDGSPSTYLQSFDVQSAKIFRDLTKNVPIVQLMYDRPSVEKALEQGFTNIPNFSEKGLEEISSYADGIGMYYQDVTPELISEIHHKSLFAHAYTLNRDLEEYLTLQEAGIDGIFSNHVDVSRLVNEFILGCEQGPVLSSSALVAVPVVLGLLICLAGFLFWWCRRRNEPRWQRVRQAEDEHEMK